MMAKNCDKIAKMMEEKGCTGKRVTLDLIESRIVDVEYQTITIAGQKMMYCGIRMDNGFVAVGKPATCIDPSNWRDEIGQKISYDNSFEELWKLEAYRLMSETIVDPCPHEGFTSFASKPITRFAVEVTAELFESITPNIEEGETSSTIVVEGKPYTFRHYEPVNVGDFIVFLMGDDIYHCMRNVFLERNHA